MRFLFWDLETTGFLEDEAALPTEIGCVVWDSNYKRIVSGFSHLMDIGDVKPSDEAMKISNMSPELWRERGINPKTALSLFATTMQSCDAMVARNGVRFDWPFICRAANRYDVSMPKIPLIDDYWDVDYPDHVRGRSLSHVAADLGFLNPFPHSALGDAMTLARVFELAEVDLDSLVGKASFPLVEICAVVSFNDKDLAKERDFKWDSDAKKWWKMMRENKYNPAQYPFKTEFRRV